jgi:hypothetical protein
MDGERTIAAKTRPRKRSATEMAAAAEMHTAEMSAAMAPEMSAAMAPKMPATVAATMKMTSTAVPASVATSAVAAAAFRSGIARGRQRGRKNKDGNSNPEFRHRTLRRRGHLNLYQRECDGAVPDYARGNRAAVSSSGRSSPLARYDTV